MGSEDVQVPVNPEEVQPEVSAPVLSFGQKAVGLDFNPSGNPDVIAIKTKFAEVIDAMNALRSSTQDPEVKRLCSVAITEAQTAQMWAVKAVVAG